VVFFLEAFQIDCARMFRWRTFLPRKSPPRAFERLEPFITEWRPSGAFQSEVASFFMPLKETLYYFHLSSPPHDTCAELRERPPPPLSFLFCEINLPRMGSQSDVTTPPAIALIAEPLNAADLLIGIEGRYFFEHVLEIFRL